ncbi:uncharacterized protein ISCGN_020168 [Ixodes scapularis]
MRLWPSIRIPDIFYYLVHTKACDLQDVKAYRSLESFNYLQSGWVGNLSVHQIDEEFSFVRGQITPSQSVNQAFHTAWVCAKDCGEIVTGGCTCMAGQARVCGHVGAILWKVDFAVTKGLTGLACTDVAAKWNRGTKHNVEPARLADITFHLQKRTVDPAPNKLRLQPLLMAMDEAQIRDLHRNSPFQDLFNIPGTLLHKTFNAPRREEAPVAAGDAAVPCHGSHLATDDLPVTCTPCREFYSNYVAISPAAAAALEESTRSQQTPMWFLARRLRLTASNANKVPKTEKTSCENAVKTILCPTFTGNAATRHGQIHEPVARAQFTRDHGANVSQCGMFVCKELPWLSATPDGVIGEALLEIKCPNTDNCKEMMKSAKSKYDVRERSQKPSQHSLDDDEEYFFANNQYFKTDNKEYYLAEKGPKGYYCQVQFQMFCTGQRLCFFYLWTLHAQILLGIAFNEGYVYKIMPRLRNFYFRELLPRIEELHRREELEISDAYKELCGR